MKRVVVVLLLAIVVAVGCSPSEAAPQVKSPSEAVPGFNGAFPREPLPGVRATSHSSGDVITDSPDLWVWAEEQTAPHISRLVADPVEGVWGGQDGELFHFRVARTDYSHGRVTYGRPDPAATWLGDLVWGAEGQLVGRVESLHLMRRTADGRVTDLGPARSPAGAPFEYMDRRDGEVHLHDRLGHWYALGEDGEGFRLVLEFTSATMRSAGGLAEKEQRELGEAFQGRVDQAITRLADKSTYALVQREQLFLFDTHSQQFRLIGHPGLTPLASLNGQIVAWYPDGVALVDVESGDVQRIPMELIGQGFFPGGNGWFYAPPFRAINLLTGEVREYTDGGPLGGAVTALLPYDESRMVGSTAHFGSLFLFDP